MKYYKKINLNCIEALKEYLEEQIIKTVPETDNNLTRLISNIIDLPESLTKTINEELASYGIPELDYCRTYLRPKTMTQAIHIDGAGEVLHCAINVALRGGEGSVFHWLGGDYSIESVPIPKTNQVAFKINWNEEPKVMDSIEIIEGSYLVRIDQPHQAIAGDQDRWVFTMRFKGNPTFEQLYDLL